jgi:putative transposase
MIKNYTTDFKTKVVLELLREEETTNQISSKYGVHRSQLHQWKKTALEAITETLSDGRGRKKEKQAKEREEELKDLYAQIGELTTKLNWLKKKSGIEI